MTHIVTCHSSHRLCNRDTFPNCLSTKKDFSLGTITENWREHKRDSFRHGSFRGSDISNKTLRSFSPALGCVSSMLVSLGGEGNCWQPQAIFWLASGLVKKRECLFPNSLRKGSGLILTGFEWTELGHMSIPECHCGQGNGLFWLDLLGSISVDPHEQRMMGLWSPDPGKKIKMLLLADWAMEANQAKLYQDIKVCLWWRQWCLRYRTPNLLQSCS